MTELKATPGPWRFFEFQLTCGAQSARADIAICSGFDSLRSQEEEQANAHLIAAAPELYEALKWAMCYVEQVRITDPLPEKNGEDIAYKYARNALAKARGKV